MEKFSKRTTATILSSFLLVWLGFCFTVFDLAEPKTTVHCGYNSATVTCAPTGKF
jgi:hypothetical protein